jgi:UDP-glucuronate 4-epimerase
LKILVTGAAGFIGYTTAKQLLERGETVVGLDNFNDYYDVSLKNARAAILDNFDNFSNSAKNLYKFVRADVPELIEDVSLNKNMEQLKMNLMTKQVNGK